MSYDRHFNSRYLAMAEKKDKKQNTVSGRGEKKRRRYRLNKGKKPKCNEKVALR